MASALQQPAVNPGKVLSGQKSLAGKPDDGFVSEEDRRLAEQARTERERHRQVLNLERQSILRQTTSQPGRRVALEAALNQVEGQIAQLD